MAPGDRSLARTQRKKKIGELCKKQGYKIEMICPKAALDTVVSAIRKTHSYETPEINIMKLVDD